VLDPNPDREVPGRKPIDNPRLARTFRSFLTHVKSNRLTTAELRLRLKAGFAGFFGFRHEMFLSLFERLWGRWEERLSAERSIDFEDMLNQAVDCIEQGRWASPYELVMVDEFQDASQARARLVGGLVKKPGSHLFAVGDDWQSINRFAGADLGVMTDFETRSARP
jgi:DNA helicase-4